MNQTTIELVARSLTLGSAVSLETEYQNRSCEASGPSPNLDPRF